MPRFFDPKQSSAHRIACIALYRALLSRCSCFELPTDISRLPVNPIKDLVRKQFRRNQYETSRFLVIAALKVGYEAENLLHSASNGDKAAFSKVVSLLREVYSQGNADHKRLLVSPPPVKPRSRLPEPYPGAKPVLESRPRPFSELTGRRHVPILSNARDLPFLRFKKPQSPYLSRVLRNKLQQRQTQMDNIDKLDQDLRWAADEDVWDRLVKGPAKNNQSWQTEPWKSKRELRERLSNYSEKAKDTASRMLRIVDEERRLYKQERKIRKMEKNKKRQERREAERDVADGIKTSEVAVDHQSIALCGETQSKSASTKSVQE